MDEMLQIQKALERQAMEVGFGTIAVFAKIHDGQVFNLDAQKYHTHKTPNGNPDAFTIVTKLVKAMQDAKTSGQLSFTLDFNKGQSTKVIVQDVNKHKVL